MIVIAFQSSYKPSSSAHQGLNNCHEFSHMYDSIFTYKRFSLCWEGCEMAFPARKIYFGAWENCDFYGEKMSEWENHLKEGRNEHLWTLNFIVSFINWNSRSNNEPIITLKTAIIISQVSAINATATHISNNNWKNENKYNSLGNLNQLKITFLFLLTTTAATTTSSSHGSS